MTEDNKLYRLEAFRPTYKPRIYTLKRIDYSTDMTPSKIVSAPCFCPYQPTTEYYEPRDCDSTCALFCFTREGSGWTVTLNCCGRILRDLALVDEG
jgi:hypothetical protein